MSDQWSAPNPGPPGPPPAGPYGAPPPPPGTPGTPGTPPPVFDPFATPPGAATASGRGPGKKILAVVGAVAVLAAGAFAVVRITGNDDDGGAASPEDVANGFVTALENEDVLGLIDLLLPGERETFREPLIDMVDHLRRLEVLSDEASLSGIAGLDIVVDDVEIDVEETNVEDISNVIIDATLSVSVDGDAVPIGDLLLDEAFGGDRPDLDADPESADVEDLRFTTVQRDGRWYLSGFYTAAEYARDGTGEDVPDEGVELRGGESPEDALDVMFEAISDLDVEAAIGALDPTEAEALQRYAPLFLDATRDLDEELGFEWEISDVEYDVRGSGSRRTVGITALSFQYFDQYSFDQIDVRLEDGCVRGEFNGEDIDVCADDLGDLEQQMEDELGSDAEPAMDLIETFTEAFDDYETPGIVVHEVDGRWYVSPIRSVFDAVNGVLAALDREELEAIVRDADSFLDFVFDSALGF